MRKIITFLLATISIAVSSAQTAEETQQIERVKQSSNFYWGMGTGYSESEARTEALTNMSQKIEVVVEGTSSTTYEGDSNGAGEDKVTDQKRISSLSKFSDYEEISYESNTDGRTQYNVLVYIDKSIFEKQKEKTLKGMKTRVVDFLVEGQIQEGKANVGDALKYYNWALNLARFYKIDDKISETEGRNIQAWLTDKIKTVMLNIEFDVAGTVYEEDEYDHHLINIKATYNSHPISGLDVSYFNGDGTRQLHVKNGEGTLAFHSLDNVKDVNLLVKYNYNNDSELYPDFAEAYSMITPMDFDKYKKFPVDLSSKKEVKKSDAKKSDTKTAELANMPADVKPQVNKLKPEAERITFDAGEAQPYIEIAEKVKAVLPAPDSKRTVRDLFTDEGWNQFQRLLSFGKISIVKTPSYVVEQSNHYIRVSSIPVMVKEGKNSRNERIVLRFDPESKLISSLGYTLTEDAENDIFRDNQWKLNARYSLLKFMEDYQTAFALRDEKYLRSIFSDDAIIITGKIQEKTKMQSGYKDIPVMNQSLSDGIEYRQFNKEEYLKHLSTLFNNPMNKYLYLIFENAYITQVKTPSYMSDAYWIELKQHYRSSIYSDVGYLSLQIGMKSDGSQIYVRTWTPNFISLDELKKRYPMD